MIPLIEQVCNACRRKLSIEEFNRDKSLRYGRRYTCKACARATAKRSRLRRIKETNGLYGTYYAIKKRCYNKNHKSYQWYGSKGISMCEQWRGDPNKFYEWALSNGYAPGLQVDRVDNSKNYSPENCRFLTSIENSRRSSATKLDKPRVRCIKRMLSRGVRQRRIADIFGLSQSSISLISSGINWRDV